jgi:hypothetical protein
MKKLRIIDGQWRVQSQFDVYADGYYVGNTRNNQGEGNNNDIDHAILIADAGNTYHATGMMPSSMADRIKALEDGLRKLDDWARSCPPTELMQRIDPVVAHARALLTPINEGTQQ